VAILQLHPSSFDNVPVAFSCFQSPIFVGADCFFSNIF
jgi:hypothetical protein